MKVYVNDKEGTRKIVKVELLKESSSTIRVKLEDGNVITRKKKRDLYKEE